jgi:hypothetical protein
MFGIGIYARKPRAGEYSVLAPGMTAKQSIAGVEMRITNGRKTPVFLKWRI